jgi:hypothetical protein
MKGLEFVVHPLMTIRIFSSNNGYLNYFHNEYERVGRFDPSQSGTVITVRIVKSIPERNAGDRVRIVRFKQFFRYRYLVRGLESNEVEIYFEDCAVAHVYAELITLFLQAQLLEPIMYLKLLQQNVLFMHSAGVSDGTSGFVFPAYGGTGKTTLTLGLMAEGMALLGDDLLLVDPESRTFPPYLRPLPIYSY